jgi:hypothetical protein
MAEAEPERGAMFETKDAMGTKHHTHTLESVFFISFFFLISFDFISIKF